MAPQQENENSGKPIAENPKDILIDDPNATGDFDEIMAVNQSLDELSSALDTIEARTDSVMAKLLELLNSNKEIRQSFANENSNKSTEN